MENEEPSNRKFMFWLMWGMFVMSVFIYGIVVYTLGNSDVQGQVVDLVILNNTFYVLSILAAVISVFVVDRFFKIKLNMQKQSETLNEGKILQLYYPYFLVKIMFAEAIASFGFCLAIIGAEKMHIYLPFGVFSLLILLVNIPKLDNLVN